MLGRRSGAALPPVVGRGAASSNSPLSLLPRHRRCWSLVMLVEATIRSAPRRLPLACSLLRSFVVRHLVVCFFHRTCFLYCRSSRPLRSVWVRSLSFLWCLWWRTGRWWMMAGVRGRRFSPASGRLLVRHHRRPRWSLWISTVGASTSSAIHTSPRDAPTPPGAFGATGSVTVRRTARSRGFFSGEPVLGPPPPPRGGGGGGGSPPPPPALPRRSAQPPPPPPLRWDSQWQDSPPPPPSPRRDPPPRFATTASGFSPADALASSVLSPASLAAGPSRSRSSTPSSRRGPSRCCWVAP
jgi:hypothetical protein